MTIETELEALADCNKRTYVADLALAAKAQLFAKDARISQLESLLREARERVDVCMRNAASVSDCAASADLLSRIDAALNAQPSTCAKSPTDS